jgi:hypothetical protein
MSLLAALAPHPRALSATASHLEALGITSLPESQIGEMVRCRRPGSDTQPRTGKRAEMIGGSYDST